MSSQIAIPFSCKTRKEIDSDFVIKPLLAAQDASGQKNQGSEFRFHSNSFRDPEYGLRIGFDAMFG
jgi:hypothetical protein